MARRIIWTPEAEKRFSDVIYYLEKKFSKKEAGLFIVNADRVINHIARFPKAFRLAGKSDLREALITEHNLLIYKATRKTIYILTFWDTRQNPPRKFKK